MNKADLIEQIAQAAEISKSAAERATNIATAVATARDLVNTPPSHLFPDEFAKRAKALGEAAGLDVEVLSGEQEARYGYLAAINTTTQSPRRARGLWRPHRRSRQSGP